MLTERKYVCRFCGKEIAIQADEEKFIRLDSGVHIQDVFPELSANDREIMISGICGECFDKIFADEDDEECLESELFVSKYDEKTDIFSDKYEGD